MAKMTEKQRAAKREKIIALLNDLPLLDDDLEHLMKSAAYDFSGNMQILQNAFGALCIGRIYGWRVLRLVLDKGSYSKYQKLLNLKFSEACDERGILADRSIALGIADTVGGFWKMVTGEQPGKGSQVAPPHGDLTSS